MNVGTALNGIGAAAVVIAALLWMFRRSERPHCDVQADATTDTGPVKVPMSALSLSRPKQPRSRDDGR